MQIDYYGVEHRDGRLQPDMEHELSREEAHKRARTGQPVVTKIFVRTDGAVDLADLERRLQAALGPMGLK